MRVGDVQWNKKPQDEAGTLSPTKPNTDTPVAYGQHPYSNNTNPASYTTTTTSSSSNPASSRARPGVPAAKKAIKPTKAKCEKSAVLCPPREMYGFKCDPFPECKDPSFSPCTERVGKDPKWNDDEHRCKWVRCGDLGEWGVSVIVRPRSWFACR